MLFFSIRRLQKPFETLCSTKSLFLLSLIHRLLVDVCDVGQLPRYSQAFPTYAPCFAGESDPGVAVSGVAAPFILRGLGHSK